MLEQITSNRLIAKWNGIHDLMRGIGLEQGYLNRILFVPSIELGAKPWWLRLYQRP